MQWIEIPKYTSRNHIGDIYDWLIDYDDRVIITKFI
jgi:hypothetical protein